MSEVLKQYTKTKAQLTDDGSDSWMLSSNEEYVPRSMAEAKIDLLEKKLNQEQSDVKDIYQYLKGIKKHFVSLDENYYSIHKEEVNCLLGLLLKLAKGEDSPSTILINVLKEEIQKLKDANEAKRILLHQTEEHRDKLKEQIAEARRIAETFEKTIQIMSLRKYQKQELLTLNERLDVVLAEAEAQQ